MNEPGAVRVTIAGRPALVVGSGPGALTAVAALRAAGATVRVITDDPDPALGDLAQRGLVDLTTDEFSASDLVGVSVVAARSGDPARDAAIEAAAVTAGVALLSAAKAETAQGDSSAELDSAGTGTDRDGGTDAGPGTGAGGVVLVGAGPGDPGLITRAGYAALLRADVVVADRLTPLALLEGLPRQPLIIDAAKVPGGASMPQHQINELLVEHALAGRRVVRFKGGDPFVFGRGLEELQACAAAGVPVEVIPGVTSAVSIPALAGIPVTHRGLTHAFTVVSGHLPPGHPDSRVDWTALARSGATLVLLMAVRTLPAICRALTAAGLPGSTPVATVVDGAGPDSVVVQTTLDRVDEHLDRIHAPAVTVIGAVVDAARGSAPATR